MGILCKDNGLSGRDMEEGRAGGRMVRYTWDIGRMTRRKVRKG